MSVGIKVNVTVEDIVSSIKKLKKAEKEMLLLLLSDKDKEIVKRVREIKTKRVKPLTREEILKDVL